MPAAALLALLAAAGPLGGAPALPAPPVVPGRPGPESATTAPARGPALEEVSGRVAAVDRRAQAVTVETAAGPVVLSLDRNTLVFAGGTLGTVLDLAPGALVRAGRGPGTTAWWVEVTARPPAR